MKIENSSRSQQEELEMDITSSEVKEAMFSIKDGKAHGPDGFNVLFFKRTWGIVWFLC